MSFSTGYEPVIPASIHFGHSDAKTFPRVEFYKKSSKRKSKAAVK